MRFLKDLLFTDTHLIKGHAKTGGQRLSSFLNSTRKRFLEMEEAALIRHAGGGRMQAGLMLVRMNDILFAYEMEETGDEGMKNLGVRDRAEVSVHVHLRCGLPLQLSGKVRRRVVESDTLSRKGFVVVTNPTLHGCPANQATEYALIQNIPYLILNRDRIALLFF